MSRAHRYTAASVLLPAAAIILAVPLQAQSRLSVIGGLSSATMITAQGDRSKGFTRTSSDETFSLDISYLELPLLISATYGRGPMTIVVLGGPAVAFRTSCSAADSSSNPLVVSNCD